MDTHELDVRSEALRRAERLDTWVLRTFAVVAIVNMVIVSMKDAWVPWSLGVMCALVILSVVTGGLCSYRRRQLFETVDEGFKEFLG